MEPGGEFKSLIEIVANSTEAFTAALFLPVASEAALKLVACCSLSRHVIEDCTIPLGHGLVGWVAEHDKQMLVSPFRHDSRALLFYDRDEAIKSFLALPVRLPGGRVGVLAIDSKKGYVFPPKVQKVLAGFAEHFANLAERSEEHAHQLEGLVSFEELRAFGRKLTASESLERIENFVANVPQALVPHTGLALALAIEDPERLEVVRAPGFPIHKLGTTTVHLGASLVGWVFRRGRALYLSDIEAKRKRSFVFHPREPRWAIRSFLGVPLKVAERTIGVLAFTSDRQGEFPKHTTEVLSILSDLVSLGVANAAARSADAATPRGGLVRWGEFHGAIEQKLSSERGRPLAVLVVDPRNLARVNARHGFVVADRLLEAAARLVATTLGPGDAVLPVEGGRILVLRDGMDSEEAPAYAERLARAFSERLLAVEELEVALAVRVGWAVAPSEARDREDLVRRAFDRLESVKREARAEEERAGPGSAN